MNVPLWAWCAVVALILALLAVDFATNRGDHAPTLRRAVITSAAWIGVSVLFGIGLGVVQGPAVAQQYFAAYLVEKALSIDNIFVFALLFRALAVPPRYQRRVLSYGVVGALVLRAAFIAGGLALLERFSWILYVFGAFLVIVGIRMMRGEAEPDPQRNPVVRIVRRVLPVTPDYVGQQFFARVDGRRFVTPLFVALVAIETTDVVFATDSLPAIFGITTDAFVVFTSNAFAVLGLRALYFVFAEAIDRFRYLSYGLAVLVFLIGVKMLLSHVVTISVAVSLAGVIVVVGASVLLSVWDRRRQDRRAHPGPEGDP